MEEKITRQIIVKKNVWKDFKVQSAQQEKSMSERIEEFMAKEVKKDGNRN